MIGNAKYYLGGYNGSNVTVDTIYQYERKISGSDYYYGTNPNSWTGKLALMYASDYGYASSNCENKRIYDSNSSSNDIRACNTTNWLYNIKKDEWLLPQEASDRFNGVSVLSDGRVGSGNVIIDQFAVRPVLYLISSVQIAGGNGTSSSPYTLGL